ncbi:MAG: hypothetical protein V4627_06180 [Pseudomonadota bacterium]
MTLLSAPGHTGTALAAAVGLTSFGFMFAKYSMEIVMLPIGVLSFMFRLVVGGKAKPKSKHGSDRIDSFGRALFVATYSFISAIFGLYVGALDGGMGWFLSAAMFGAIGIVLALLVPMDLLWAAEGGDASTAGQTEVEKADLEQARRDGVPVVLFADKVVKVAAKAVMRGTGTDNRP